MKCVRRIKADDGEITVEITIKQEQKANYEHEKVKGNFEGIVDDIISAVLLPRFHHSDIKIIKE
jgi:hypothetical protein